MGITLGWSSEAATLDSIVKRRRNSALPTSDGAISFSATFRSSVRSVAQ